MPKSTGRRAKRLTGVAAVLVAVVAGVAVAYFVTNQTFAANAASGGTLAVTAEGLPLDFGGEKLFPTHADSPRYTVVDEFTVANDNPVPVSYLLSASCAGCVTDTDAAAQYENLYVRITTTEAGPIPGATQLDQETEVYKGKLADLSEEDLGELDEGSSRTYDVEMWLADTGAEQPQDIQSPFELTIAAKTIGSPAESSSPIPVG